MSTATTMDWGDELSTGVTMLDMQHKDLFDCVRSLAKAAESGRLLLTIHAIDRLRKYVRFHFSTEEHLMSIHGYPRLKEHRAEHRKFANDLAVLMMENTRRDNSAAMAAFLMDWLVHHVAESDMDYVPYLATQSAPVTAEACCASL